MCSSSGLVVLSAALPPPEQLLLGLSARSVLPTPNNHWCRSGDSGKNCLLAFPGPSCKPETNEPKLLLQHKHTSFCVAFRSLFCFVLEVCLRWKEPGVVALFQLQLKWQTFSKTLVVDAWLSLMLQVVVYHLKLNALPQPSAFPARWNSLSEDPWSPGICTGDLSCEDCLLSSSLEQAAVSRRTYLTCFISGFYSKMLNNFFKKKGRDRTTLA